MTETYDETRVVQKISVKSLVCRPQVREQFDEESLAGLAQTIKETGILHPLLVRRDGGEFVVVDGERRLRAAKLAELSHLPVIIDDRELSDGEVLLRQLVANGSREDLQPLERAKGIEHLIRVMGWTASQAAVKLGMSAGSMTKLRTVLTLPPSIQEQVANGTLPLSTAYELSQVKDTERQCELAKQAVNGGLTRDDISARSKSRKSNRRSAAKSNRASVGRNRIIVPVDAEHSVAIAGPGMTLASVILWLTELLDRFRSLQDQNLGLNDAVKAITPQAS